MASFFFSVSGAIFVRESLVQSPFAMAFGVFFSHLFGGFSGKDLTFFPAIWWVNVVNPNSKTKDAKGQRVFELFLQMTRRVQNK